MPKDINLIKKEVAYYIAKYYIPAFEDLAIKQDAVFEAEEADALRPRRAGFRLGKTAGKKKEAKTSKSEAREDSVLSLGAASLPLEESAEAEEPALMMAAPSPTNRKLDSLIDQIDETFSQRLLRMIDERGMTDAEAYNKAYVDRRHFSKIRNDANYAPTKKTVLAFAIALELSVDETKDLLNSAGFSLSRSSKLDIIIEYFLENEIYDTFEINEVLYDYGLPIFE